MKRNPTCVICRREIWIPPILRERARSRSSNPPRCLPNWNWWFGFLFFSSAGMFLTIVFVHSEPLYSILVIAFSVGLVLSVSLLC